MSVLEMINRIDTTLDTNELDRIKEEAVALMTAGSLDADDLLKLLKRSEARAVAIEAMPAEKLPAFAREGTAFKNQRMLTVGGSGMKERNMSFKNWLLCLSRAGDVAEVIVDATVADSNTHEHVEALAIECLRASEHVAKVMSDFIEGA